MKAIRIHWFGDPEVLELDEVPVPRPGENELLVRIHAASMNFFIPSRSWSPRKLPEPGATLPDWKIARTVDGRQGGNPPPAVSWPSIVGRPRREPTDYPLPRLHDGPAACNGSSDVRPGRVLGRGCAAGPRSPADAASTRARLCLATRLLVVGWHQVGLGLRNLRRATLSRRGVGRRSLGAARARLDMGRRPLAAMRARHGRVICVPLWTEAEDLFSRWRAA